LHKPQSIVIDEKTQASFGVDKCMGKGVFPLAILKMNELVGRYKVLEKIGEGGMGEVYLALDSNLGRKVALKFLSSDKASDPESRRRFAHEARAQAMLSHPNIATFHEVGEENGKVFIVMEYIEGQPLSRLAQTEKLSLTQILDLAIQTAEGLQAAHEKGVVHRDVKPENLLVTSKQHVKITDFGLAKWKGATTLTQTGARMGTAYYMSPEQVEGKKVDHRSDIFSLGVILYELFAGRRPFEGETETAIFYDLVHSEPQPLARYNRNLPPGLEPVVFKCLAKAPEERYQSAADLGTDLRRERKSLEYYRSGVVSAPLPLRAALERFFRNRLTWGILALLVGAAGFAISHFYFRPPEAPLTYAHLLPPDGNSFPIGGAGNIAISPDGQVLAFVARDTVTRKWNLWVRPLNSLAALPLPGTEEAHHPFWSADSRYVGFFAQGKLKKIQATGGPPLTICDAPVGRGGTWNKNDIILFTPNSEGPIHKVAAAGGTSVPLTTLDSAYQDFNHRWPHFLPDGKHFLFLARTVGNAGGEKDAICAGALEGKEIKRLFEAKSNVMYAQGFLIFSREAALLAQPFDPGSLKLTGDAAPLAEKAAYITFRSEGIFSVSPTGVLVYQTGSTQVSSDLVIFNRAGRPLDTVAAKERYFKSRFSPDEKKIALHIFDSTTRNADIWVYDLARPISTRLTIDSASDFGPIWSPDGSRIVFGSRREKEVMGLYAKNAFGVGADTLLLESKFFKLAGDWSRDGRYLLYTTGDSSGQFDLWVLPLFGERKPFPFTRTSFREDENATFSPDGRWIAYSSDETRKEEVYVAPFPGPGGKWQVSISEGEQPHWRRDGKELFYTDKKGGIMAAEVDGSGTDFKIGTVKPLFQSRGGLHDVSADGQRFLINTVKASASDAPITLVMNWTKALKKK